MLRLVVALAALAWAAPASAQQVSATLPVTCAPGGPCVRSTPVTNPDGTTIGGGGTSGPLPAGTNTIGGVVARGASTLTSGQVSVGTTSTLVAAARTGRARITVSVGAANTCAFSGTSGVTLTTGFALQPVAGASRPWEYSGALYAVCSATTTISFDEIY
jgi:hypothetical protein